jgi:RimJ/RimL family protein N-acetyltransferase
MADPAFPQVALHPVQADDLPIFFRQQLDPQANYMAAFTPRDPTDKAAFYAHWAKIQADPGIIILTIIYEGAVAGHVLAYTWDGDLEVGYWLGREFWGKGVATQALAEFLKQFTTRPLYGHAAKDNLGSLRVLEKNGFVRVGEDKGFSPARQVDVEEWIYVKE